MWLALAISPFGLSLLASVAKIRGWLPLGLYTGDNEVLVTNPLLPALGMVHLVLVAGWALADRANCSHPSFPCSADRRRVILGCSALAWGLLILLLRLAQ